MNKKIVISLAVLVMILAGGILAWQFWPKQVETPVPAVEMPEEIGAPKEGEEVIKDKTADWKTYRNEEVGIEFKYPANIRLAFSQDENVKIINFLGMREGEDLPLNLAIIEPKANEPCGAREYAHHDLSVSVGDVLWERRLELGDGEIDSWQQAKRHMTVQWLATYISRENCALTDKTVVVVTSFFDGLNLHDFSTLPLHDHFLQTFRFLH